MDWGGVLPLRQMGAKEKWTEVGGGGSGRRGGDSISLSVSTQPQLKDTWKRKFRPGNEEQRGINDNKHVRKWIREEE